MWFIAGGVEVYATIYYRDCRPGAFCEDRYGRRAAAAVRVTDFALQTDSDLKASVDIFRLCAS